MKFDSRRRISLKYRRVDSEIVPDRIRTSIQQVLERSGKQSELWKRGSGEFGRRGVGRLGTPGSAVRSGETDSRPDRPEPSYPVLLRGNEERGVHLERGRRSGGKAKPANELFLRNRTAVSFHPGVVVQPTDTCYDPQPWQQGVLF